MAESEAVDCFLKPWSGMFAGINFELEIESLSAFTNCGPGWRLRLVVV